MIRALFVLLAASLASSCESFDGISQGDMNAARCMADVMRGDRRFDTVGLAVNPMKEAAVTFGYRHDDKPLRGVLDINKGSYITDALLPDDDPLWPSLKTRCGVERDFYVE